MAYKKLFHKGQLIWSSVNVFYNELKLAGEKLENKRLRKISQTKTRRAKSRRAWLKEKIKHDVNFRLRLNLRTRLATAIKKGYRSGSAVRDLGCEIAFLKEYLENQFSIEMKWENWGKIWQIDHIEPLCSFDLTDRIELLKVCHYTNLRPLTCEANRAKISSDKKKAKAFRRKRLHLKKEL